ncbi:MAG: hypothetical protein KF901_03765 [Myxococcales bacterium]|nr:hypothetical protein [Myxococcales bacterium]
MSRIGVWVCALSVSWVVGARAQEPSDVAEADERARERYEAAVVAFDAGSYEAALDLFRSAYALSPRPRLLYNIGTTADRLRRNQEALDAFEAYLEALPTASNATAVQRRIDVLREDLTRQRALVEAAMAAQGSSEVTVRPDDEAPRRRRRRWGGALAALAVVGGGVALAIALARSGGGAQTPEHDFVIQTLGGRR